jgi:hypothetical protein
VRDQHSSKIPFVRLCKKTRLLRDEVLVDSRSKVRSGIELGQEKLRTCIDPKWPLPLYLMGLSFSPFLKR